VNTCRQSVFLCGAAFVLLCLPAGRAWAQAAGAERPLNIVFILADDLGYGDLRSYNPASKIATVEIDRLAAQGMRFTDAHSPSAVCTPTRYGLLTGRYAWRSKLKKSVLNGYSPLLIEPGRPTIASILKTRGYATAAIGKWHLGLGTAEPADFSRPLEPGPTNVGFDYFFGIPASLDMAPYVFVENTAVTVPPTGTIASSEMRRRGGGGYWREGPISPGFTHEGVLPALTEKAVSFIGQQSPAAPFLLYLPLTAPHTPWMPTAEFRGTSGADYYGDFVAQVDAAVGRVLRALDAAKVSDQTLVIFTSDNGAHWLPADIEKWGHRANGALRGQKADIYEGGHRIPFVARWPGKVTAGSTSNALVCLTDIFATVADIIGAPLPADAAEDSFSILSALRGTPPAAPVREAIVHHSNDGTFAVRQGPWKLAFALGSHGFSEPRAIEPEAGGPRGQLYNLDDDPAEQRNRWLEQPDVVARLTALLERYQAAGRSR
jgi:arylsulfatase A-like enzyme